MTLTMTETRLDRPVLARERLLAFAALAIWMLWTFLRYHDTWGNDLAALWFAGHFWAAGQPDLIYAAPREFFGGTPPAWEDLRALYTGNKNELAFPYIYPPLWAGVMGPVAQALSPRGFFEVMLAVHLAMLGGMVLLAERIARPAHLSYGLFIGWGVAALALTTATKAAVVLNQPTVTTAFLVLASFALLRRHAVLAGVVLAVAASLKLTPLVFALLFLQARKPAALFSFALSGAALAAISVLWMGWPLHRAFLDQLHLASQTTVWAMMNPSLRILILDGAGWLGLVDRIDMLAPHTALFGPPKWVGQIAAALALIIALPGAWLLAHRPGPEATALGLLAVSLGLFLFGPLSWLHYLVLPLPLLPALAQGFSTRNLGIALGLLLVANSTPVLRRDDDLGPDVAHSWCGAADLLGRGAGRRDGRAEAPAAALGAGKLSPLRRAAT